MFSIFGKRKPVEEPERPPIPSARPEDSYVMIEPSSNQSRVYPNVGRMYPNMGGTESTYPMRPAPFTPNLISETFHYMQGVPFSLSRELQMVSNKDTFAIEIGDLLAFATSKMNMSKFDYDFSLEKSVISEF